MSLRRKEATDADRKTRLTPTPLADHEHGTDFAAALTLSHLSEYRSPRYSSSQQSMAARVDG